VRQNPFFQKSIFYYYESKIRFFKNQFFITMKAKSVFSKINFLLMCQLNDSVIGLCSIMMKGENETFFLRGLRSFFTGGSCMYIGSSIFVIYID